MLSWRGLLIVVAGLVVLIRNLPGALMCLWPGFVRVREEDDPPEPRAERGAVVAMGEDLVRLGFIRLGVRLEAKPLNRSQRWHEYAHPSLNAYASIELDEVPLLTLVTPFDDGSFVVTSDHRRPGIERAGRYLAGGVPGATPEQLLAAHRRRAGVLIELGKSPKVEASLKAAVEARRRFLRGVGAMEIRTANSFRFVVAVLGVLAALSVLLGQPLGPGESPGSGGPK